MLVVFYSASDNTCHAKNGCVHMLVGVCATLDRGYPSACPTLGTLEKLMT